MEKLIALVVKAPKTRSQNDDDFADRLSSRYTVVQLVVFAVLVGFTQYVRTPITCWTPVHFTGSQVKYAAQYCWIKNTYYLPWNEDIPEVSGNDKQRMISYYQWIPFILLTQAVLFYLPCLFWHGLNSKAGVDADSIMQAAQALSCVDTTETNEMTLKIISHQMTKFLEIREKKRKIGYDRWNKSNTCCGRRAGCYLLTLFLISKILYIGNIIGQLFLLNEVLGAKYVTFGADIARYMAENVDWTEESYVAFPRVTLCDFKVRGQDMKNAHSYTVQCVLPINLYNEKIYVFMWFWMMLIGVVSAFSFLIWFMRSLWPMDRIRFVRRHVAERLNYLIVDPPERIVAIRKFTNDYLQLDGVLLLRLIAHNTDGITTTQIASALFDKWATHWEDSDHKLESDALTEVKSEKSRL